MRNLFIIGMLVAGAFMAGWFQINREGDRTTIEINRNEIRSDTRRAIDRGRDFLDRNGEYVEQQAYAQPQPGTGSVQQVWGQEQVASQPGQWGPIQQQSFQTAPGQPGSYTPNQPVYQQPQQVYPYQQQSVYPPATR